MKKKLTNPLRLVCDVGAGRAVDPWLVGDTCVALAVVGLSVGRGGRGAQVRLLEQRGVGRVTATNDCLGLLSLFVLFIFIITQSLVQIE